MLNDSCWNNPGILTEDNECVGADLGCYSTEHINVLSPFNELDNAVNSTYAAWNEDFSSDRELVEKEFGPLRTQ